MVNENKFVGWTDVHIVRSLNQASATFVFSATQHPDNIDVLSVGNKCEISFNGQKIVTGYIDKMSASYDSTSHIFQIYGRSNTKDLVDCSVIDNFQFSKMSIKNLVTAIAGIYGIVVKTSSTDSTIINNFQVEQNGETCFQAIQRISETKALRITDNAEGELVLTQASEDKSSNIIDGSNVLGGSLTVDESERYSKITVKGQSRSTDNNYGLNTSQVIGSAVDENVLRKRELIIVAENDATTVDVKKIAEWEIAARAAKSFNLNYTLQGWLGSGESLWFENELVSVKDSILGIYGDYLIVSVDYILNDGGSIVKLTLADPETYIPKPLVKKKVAPKNTTTRSKTSGWAYS